MILRKEGDGRGRYKSPDPNNFSLVFVLGHRPWRRHGSSTQFMTESGMDPVGLLFCLNTIVVELKNKFVSSSPFPSDSSRMSVTSIICSIFRHSIVRSSDLLVYYRWVTTVLVHVGFQICSPNQYDTSTVELFLDFNNYCKSYNTVIDLPSF